MAVPADLHGLSSEDVLAIQGVIVKYGFLIDAASYVTGQLIGVNGGRVVT